MAANDKLLLAVCRARVNAKVVELLGCEDDIVVDMILRHVVRCANAGTGDDADIPALIQLLAILVGEDKATALANVLLAEPPTPHGSVRQRKHFATWPFATSVGPLPMDRDNSVHCCADDGPFGMAARGVEVRPCTADLSVGHGVFATRVLQPGELVGVYLGERLTFHEWWLRHGASRSSTGQLIGVSDDDASPEAQRDRLAAAERYARLEALETGSKPIGGADNMGAYVFKLPPDACDHVNGDRVHCIDAEDPHRSSWCRFLNHASNEEDTCNVEAQIDDTGHVWFVVRPGVVIERGTELRFDYGPTYVSFPLGTSR